MQLKEYQQRALETIRGYLELLADLKKKAEGITDPDLAFDFAAKAWEKAGFARRYLPRKNGLGQPLPIFCLKVPTGGGKTLLAVKAIDIVNTIYRKRQMGLVLWIVPTTQIYRQTIQHLKDRDHPYRQHLDLASGGHTLILEKTDHFAPQDVQENLVVLMLMLPSANRKTQVRELDESYVFCFQQRGKELLDNIKQGFEEEGLGDLRGHIATDDERGGAPGDGRDKLYGMREQFKKAARRTLLPVFVVKNGHGWPASRSSSGAQSEGWRPVNYEMDIAPRIPWSEVNLKPVMQLTLSMFEEKDVEIGITLTDDKHRLIETRGVKDLKEGGIRVDPVFMTRQLGDIVPNPWQAHEFSKKVLSHFRNLPVRGVQAGMGGPAASLGAGTQDSNERLIANNFVFMIEELRKQLEAEKERLAENIFCSMLEKDELRFLIIGNNFDWSFPKSIAIKPTSKFLNKEKGGQLELSLYEQVPEDDFNETEKAVAWYLENQRRLFFWYRNRSRQDYSIQGWREHRIYPDFIFTATNKDTQTDYERVYVVETKGLHLKDNAKTDYIRKVFDICTRQAKSRNWNELGLEMKDKVLRFEVLAEDEWEAKLNEVLREQ